MKFKIIGSAAGGGFPQWNCNYHLSQKARKNLSHVKVRTQSSLAASMNGKDWILFNASPDIREQIANTPELQPAEDAPLRSTPIKAVVLTNADVDHIAGLLSLREKQAFNIYATSKVLETLRTNSIFNVLDPEFVNRFELDLNSSIELEGPDGPLGLSIETYAVPGKIALFLEDGSDPVNYGSEDGDTIGLRIFPTDASISDKSLQYIPGCAKVNDSLAKRLKDASCLLFDGTVFTDTEMPDAGVSYKTGQRMGHIAMSGDDGSISCLDKLNIKRKIFVHINNTNPVLDETSKQNKLVRNAGWEISYDGMEINL